MSPVPSVEQMCEQIDAIGKKAMALVEKVQGERDLIRVALKLVLAYDALTQLLREAAMALDSAGGGPLPID